MPDPISLSNAPAGGNYDPEANACVPAPPAASPAAAPPTAQTITLEPIVVAAGVQQLIDGYAPAGAGSSSEQATQRAGCEMETMKAVVACGQMVAGVVVGAPTLAGSVISGFFGGMVCGMNAKEAYLCHTKEGQ